MKPQVEGEFNVRNSLIAGAVAGMLAKTLIAPVDRIKIIFQVNGKKFKFKNGWNMAKKFYRKRGMADLWRGNNASLLRVIPYAAIQFTVHEKMKNAFGVKTYKQKLQKPISAFMAGALAGLSAITVTYPLEVCRARLATDHTYKGIWDVIYQAITFKKPSLFKGFVPAAVGIVPYSGVSFLIYELFKTRYIAQCKNSDGKNNSVPAIQNLFLGTFASLVGQTIIYPLDIIRRRIQTDINHRDFIFSTLKHIVEKEGFGGLFNGVTLSWIKGPVALGFSMVTFDVVYAFLNKNYSN